MSNVQGMKFKRILFVSIVISSFLLLITLSNCKTASPKNSVTEELSNAEIVLDSTVLSVTTVAQNLQVPWDIVYDEDNYIWFTEQHGTVSRLNPLTGEKKILLTLTDLFYRRSSGLLALAVAKDAKTEAIYAYIDYTYMVGKDIFTKVVRYTFQQDTLVNPFILLEKIKGSDGHNGNRLVIAPDGKIMLATGDANNSKNAQNLETLAGKVLRINPDGSVPTDNPIKNSYIWSYGHRNQLGLCYATNGMLYNSENGLATDDEINIIEKGRNYGWPLVEGFADQKNEAEPFEKLNIKTPIKQWTPVIAPAGIAYYPHTTIPEWHNTLIVTTLKECDFRTLTLNDLGDKIIGEQLCGDMQFGRIRDIAVAPNGDVYLATSNRDWNPTCEGFPKAEDDRIIRLRKVRTLTKKQQNRIAKARAAAPVIADIGKHLYDIHCAACHKPDGLGLAEVFPPLAGSEWIKNDSVMVRLLVKGMSDSITVKGLRYKGEMPAFDFLTNQQMADIITYVRQSFTNKEISIYFKQVEKIRTQIK